MQQQKTAGKTLGVMLTLALLLSALSMAAPGVAVGATVYSRTYTTNADFDEGTLVNVEHDTVPDQLQLSKEHVILPFIWVPNQNCTVSKVDTQTGNELGRYWVAPHSNCSPSRTTVDLQGNCWVGNRQAGTVVKTGLYEAGQCIDRNGDGAIQTSQDLNSDGDITGGEILAWGQDECVLYEVVLIPGKEGTYVPGTYGGGYDYNYWGTAPRGLAIDASNNLWAGTWSSQKYHHINGSTGAILSTIDVAPWGHNAYGAVIDQNGILWSAELGSHVLRIDPTNLGNTQQVWLGHTYGLGLDYAGHLFVGGGSQLSKIDINNTTSPLMWTKSAKTVRGVVCTSDNNVWVAGYDSSGAYRGVSRYDNNGNPIITIGGFNAPSGVAVDAAGKVWVTDISSENIHRIDPATNSVDLTKLIVGSNGHYTYSDMTGIVARTITTKIGTWTVDFDSGGGSNTPWGTVSWNSSEPTGTSVTVKVRSSNDQVNWSAWEAATNGTPLSATPDGRYLQIETTLQIVSGDVSPILYDLTVQVGNQPPVADPNGPYYGDEGSPVPFDGTGSYDPDGDPLTYDWDFGDGNVALDAGPTPSHTYDDNGVYDICLTVTDPGGLSDTKCASTKPMDVVFALDSSGSMSWNDPGGLRKTAAKSFVDKMDSSQDTAGVVSWDGGIDFTYPLSSDFPTVKWWIDQVNSSGGTNLEVGLSTAISLLDSGKQAGASWVIIFLSNGQGYYTGSATADAASKGYVIYSIGLGSYPATGPLTDMANQTGGQYYPAPTPENLQAIFDDIYVAVSGRAFIDNVAPTATFNAPTEVNEGYNIDLSLTDPYDPSNADTLAGFEYAFDCGDGSGYGAWSSDSTAACPTTDDDVRTVKGKIRDKDGGVTEYTASVTVKNVAPEVLASPHNQTVQYSDYICDVTFTATDVAADTMTAATIPDPLPDSLVLTDNGCTVSGGIKTCTWTLEGTMDQPVGLYAPDIYVSDDDGGTTGEDTNIIVVHEDADIRLDEDNTVAVEVDAEGNSPSFSLTAYVKETHPDAATDCGAADPGDINNAEVSMTLAAVGPGGSYTTVPCTHVGVTGTGYDAELEVRCDFDNIDVNTYHVQTSVVGDYYVGGPDEDVLVVFDPGLGFTTGGGWFYWPGTMEKTNFGFTMKYNKRGTKVQGSLLLIRHVAPGEKYRVKSNALYGLSIGEAGDPVFGWASFSGKCTYLEPGWLEAEGNHEFLVYVEDHGEPGKDVDQFWIEVYDKDDNVIGALSMDRDAPDNTETLGGGNIVVPHTRASDGSK